MQSARRTKDRFEKIVILGLEALPSVPELRSAMTTKENDNNLHRCACTDFKACGSCKRSTDEICQSAVVGLDTYDEQGIAKQQQRSSSKAAAKQQQEQQQSSSKAAAKQQQSAKQQYKNSIAAAQQQQSSSSGKAIQQQQQFSSSNKKARKQK